MQGCWRAPHTSHLESWMTPADAAVSICSGKKTWKNVPSGLCWGFIRRFSSYVEDAVEDGWARRRTRAGLQFTEYSPPFAVIIYFICATLWEAGCWVMQLELVPNARRVKVNWSDRSTKKCFVYWQTRPLKVLTLHFIDLGTKQTCVSVEGFSLCLLVQPVVCKKWNLGLEIRQSSRLFGSFCSSAQTSVSLLIIAN